MRRGRGGQADLDGVKVVERLAPDGEFRGSVSAVAFVGNDQVKRVNRDVEFFGVFVDFLVAIPKMASPPEKVDRHALDSGDVYERVLGLEGSSR